MGARARTQAERGDSARVCPANNEVRGRYLFTTPAFRVPGPASNRRADARFRRAVEPPWAQ